MTVLREKEVEKRESVFPADEKGGAPPLTRTSYHHGIKHLLGEVGLGLSISSDNNSDPHAHVQRSQHTRVLCGTIPLYKVLVYSVWYKHLHAKQTIIRETSSCDAMINGTASCSSHSRNQLEVYV